MTRMDSVQIVGRSKAVVILTIVFAFRVLICHAQFWDKLETEKVESDNVVLWEQVSPGNAGFANLVRYHPTIPGKVLLCPDMWNAYQSDNNGKMWYSITDPDGEGRFYHLRDVYYSPVFPEFGLALSSSLLWKTDDFGKKWEIVKHCPWYNSDNEGIDKESWKKKVASLAIDPNDKDIWFVGGGSNVRGQEWLSCYKNISLDNPRGEKAANEGKIWRTINAGNSWELVNEGLHPKAQVGRIIIDPQDSCKVYAASNYGIYKSVDGGQTWTHISAGKLDNDIIMDMDFYYNKQSGKFILYAIDQVQYIPAGTTTKCTGGIFYSDNGGVTWNKMNGNLGLDLKRLTGGVPANYYKYIASWFKISNQKAKADYPELPTGALQCFNMLSADPSREGALYIGFADPQVSNSIMPGRLWTTADNGKTWVNTARLYEESWAKDKDYWNERGNPWHENMVVGHSSPHMRFGKDYPLRSMRGVDVGVDGSVMIISDHSTMFSTDHGVTWRQVDESYTPSGAVIGNGNSNMPGLVIAQDLRGERTLLGSGEHRLWIPANDSPDERIALRYIPSAQATVSNLAFDPYNAEIVYSTSNRQENKQKIFRSTDGGETWNDYGIATPATNKWLDDFYTNGLIIDPIDNRYMYLGITRILDASKSKQGGFYYSDDFGKTFHQSNTGLPSPARVNDIKFDPRDHTMRSLFIAAQKSDFSQDSPVAEGGLYYSEDRGQSWVKINTPPSVKCVQFIKIDHTNRMYITTGYRGGGSGVWYSDDFGQTWHQIFRYPGAECIDVSPFDHNLLVVTVRFLSKNPGVYISRDRGLTWSKSNKSIGIPHQIEDIKFDIHNPEEIWMATLGCGFYKGRIENGNQIQVVKTTPKAVAVSERNPFQMKANIVNPDFKNEKIFWKSENAAIVKIDEHGMVAPTGKGHVKIWATTSEGRFSDFSVITVSK